MLVGTTIDGRKLITIGELSELYSVSKRSLRIYHDMGLLVPEYVDHQTGYRYYTPRQFPQLESILQMRALGLSLNNILVILKQRDLDTCEILFGERLDELNKEIAELTTARNSLIRQINSCKLLRHPPTLDQINLEYFPQRKGLMFEIEPYNFLDSIPGQSLWSDALDLVRTSLVSEGVPMSCFQKICCMIEQDDLEHENWKCSRALILDDHIDRGLPWHTTLPAGTYLCVYRKHTAMDGRLEIDGVKEMSEYSEKHNYKIIGPYIGEVIAEASVYACNDRNLLLRQQIQVQYK